MSETQQQPPSVLPFCIYHWRDTSTHVIRSLVLRAESIIDSGKGGKVEYHCLVPKQGGPHGRWILSARFYAINPSLIPIPSGLTLFCAKHRNEWPYDTLSVEPIYDLYDLDVSENCVFFVAYSKPVPGSAPLYVYSKGATTEDVETRAFISYSPQAPPSDEHKPESPGAQESRISGSLRAQKLTSRQVQLLSDQLESGTKGTSWGTATISPIYVMSPDIFGADPTAIKFVCNLGRCLPSNPALERSDIYWGRGTDKEPKPLYECIVDCNQLVMFGGPSGQSGGKQRPFSLFLAIREKAQQLKKEDSFTGFFKRIPSVIIAVMIGLLILAVFVVAYLSLNRKK